VVGFFHSVVVEGDSEGAPLLLPLALMLLLLLLLLFSVRLLLFAGTALVEAEGGGAVGAVAAAVLL